MIALGIPVPMRSLHRFLWDYLRFKLWRITVSPVQDPFLHLVYFSCARDFPAISLSLRSIARLEPRLVKSTTVYVDDKDPFNETQRAELQALMPDLGFGESRDFAWASLGTLKTELDAFAQVGARAQPGDLVAKVDSDILFFSMRKLALLPSLGFQFIGDGHHEQYRYSQGGFYMMRAEVARELSFAKVEESVREIVSEVGTYAEDMVIHHLIGAMGKRMLMTNLMLFPREYDRVRRFDGALADMFAAIHFVKRKHEMAHYLHQRLLDTPVRSQESLDAQPPSLGAQEPMETAGLRGRQGPSVGADN